MLQEEIATALGMDRSMVGKWENGQFKRPVSAEDVNRLSELLNVPVIEFVLALGYDVRFEGIETEEEVELLEAYRRASEAQHLAVRGALLLPSRRPAGEAGKSLRRLVGRARQDRRETEG